MSTVAGQKVRVEHYWNNLEGVKRIQAHCPDCDSIIMHREEHRMDNGDWILSSAWHTDNHKCLPKTAL